MFNYSKQNPEVSFDQLIIDGFYEYVLDCAQKKLDNPGVIDSLDELKKLWDDYMPQLSKQQQARASQLHYVVFSEIQTLPEQFTYIDIFKASLLIAIPDLLLAKKMDVEFRGFSTDQIFTVIQHDDFGDVERLSADYLTTSKSKSTERFMEFVTNNEMSLDDGALKNTAEYLQFLQTFTGYPLLHGKLMLLDMFTGYVENILNDKKIVVALSAASISFSELITMLHHMVGFCLSACVDALVINPNDIGNSQKSLSRADLTPEKMNDLQQQQERYKVIDSIKYWCDHAIFDVASNSDMVAQYRRYMKAQFCNEFSSKALKHAQRIYDVCISKNLHSLFKLYKEQKNGSMVSCVLFSIENYFSYQQITKLTESLRRFSSSEKPNVSMMQWALGFFQSAPPSLQTVVGMIDDGKSSRADILFALRKVLKIEARGNISLLAEPYKTLKSFMLDEPVEGETKDSFILKMTQLKLEDFKSRTSSTVSTSIR